MKRNKKSLRQLAKELGVSASYLSQVRSGKRPASHKVLSIFTKSVKQTVVPRAGFEPARAEAQRILSPSRLPVPPPRLSELVDDL